MEDRFSELTEKDARAIGGMVAERLLEASRLGRMVSITANHGFREATKPGDTIESFEPNGGLELSIEILPLDTEDQP